MVYKTKFLKQHVVEDFTPTATGAYSWELTDQPLAAIWITIKGELATAMITACMNDIVNMINGIDVWIGGFNVVHYSHGEKAMVMNCKLKGAWPYHVSQSHIAANVEGVTFPILFGAPYINDMMCLPGSLSNRKVLTISFGSITTPIVTPTIDIAEVILPGAAPAGCIKQEEVNYTNPGEGDFDAWLQRNWDLLKLLLYTDTFPHASDSTCGINRAGMELDDFAFGYKSVAWETLHGELMDELEGSGPVEDHTHYDAHSSAQVGMAEDLETWIRAYAQMDFFYNYDLKWRAPLSTASTAKLKLNIGDDSAAIEYITACYVPASKL